MSSLQRLRAVLPAAWAGVLLCIAFIGTPAPFALLSRDDAGRVVGRIFEQEAYFSLGLALAVLLLERSRSASLKTESLLALGTVFCTVAGYFGTQPMLAAARAGTGTLSFGQLHAVSVGFFLVKGLLVLALAWRVSLAERAS